MDKKNENIPRIMSLILIVMFFLWVFSVFVLGFFNMSEENITQFNHNFFFSQFIRPILISVIISFIGGLIFYKINIVDKMEDKTQIKMAKEKIKALIFFICLALVILILISTFGSLNRSLILSIFWISSVFMIFYGIHYGIIHPTR